MQQVSRTPGPQPRAGAFASPLPTVTQAPGVRTAQLSAVHSEVLPAQICGPVQPGVLQEPAAVDSAAVAQSQLAQQDVHQPLLLPRTAAPTGQQPPLPAAQRPHDAMWPTGTLRTGRPYLGAVPTYPPTGPQKRRRGVHRRLLLAEFVHAAMPWTADTATLVLYCGMLVMLTLLNYNSSAQLPMRSEKQGTVGEGGHADDDRVWR